MSTSFPLSGKVHVIPRGRPAGAAVALIAASTGLLAALAADRLPPVVLAGAVAVATLLLAPMWIFVPLVLGATILSDVLRVELAPSVAPLFGQGRLLTLIAGLVGLRMLVGRQALPLPRQALVPAGAYAASLFFAGVVASAYGRLDLAELQRSLSYMLAFAVGAAVAAQPAHRVPAVRALAVLTVVSGLVALLYWGWVSGLVLPPSGLTAFFERISEASRGAFLDPTRSRIPWVDHHPNRVAVLFAMLLAFVVPVLVATRQRGDFVLAVLTGVAATGGVLATQSRTGLAVLVVTGTVMALIWQSKQRGQERAVTLVGLAVAVPMVVFAYQLLPQEREFTFEDSNFQSRQFIWSDALQVSGDSPLWGYGLNYAGGPRFSGGLSAHNEYLGQLVDGGLIGVTVFVFLLAAFIRLAWIVSRRPGIDGAFGVGTLTFFAVLLVSMLVATTWRTAGSVIVSWLFLGMLTATAAAPEARGHCSSRHRR